jgi:hypothetical protein
MLKLAFAQSLNTMVPTAQNFTFREEPQSTSTRIATITLVVPEKDEIVLPLSAQYKTKKMSLLLGVPFIGLAFALFLPIAGLVTLAWVTVVAFLPSSHSGNSRLIWARYALYFRPRLSASKHAT